MGLLSVRPAAAPLCSCHIALRCVRGGAVRCRFCTGGIEGALTGGKAAVPEAGHSSLVSRLSTSGFVPSLSVCVYGAYRDKCTFVFTFCISVLLV